VSLRKYFAGQALASGTCPCYLVAADIIARWCYEIADAMVAEGNK